jgi:hypothetical protein
MRGCEPGVRRSTSYLVEHRKRKYYLIIEIINSGKDGMQSQLILTSQTMQRDEVKDDGGRRKILT